MQKIHVLKKITTAKSFSGGKVYFCLINQIKWSILDEVGSGLGKSETLP